jgi:hypothetical protein
MISEMREFELTDKSMMGEVVFDSFIPPYPPSAGDTAATAEPRIIKTGYLDMVVDSVSESSAKISAIATGQGGFVQDSDISEREDGTHFGNVTVRVPTDAFETAMTEIKAVASVVKTESTQGQDITEQYTDLEARLRNAQAQEKVYLEILDKAETVEEILQVQQYLQGIRYEIESYQGQLKYLTNVTTYSTISVALSEEPTVRIPTKEFRFGSIVREAGRALVAIAQNVAIAAIWLIIVGGGLLLPLALIVWGIGKLYAKVRRNK